MVRKVMAFDRKLTLQKAVEMVSWTHNTNTNILGYCPMTLVTGKAIVFPGISTASIATESMFESKSLRIHMDRHQEVLKQFRDSEFSSKLKHASKQRKNKTEDIKYQENDWVFYQYRDKKDWRGPVQVFCHRGVNVFVFANGDIKKVHQCQVQPYEEGPVEDKSMVPGDDVEDEDHDDDEVEEVQNEGPVTRSKDRRTNALGAYWMNVEKTEWFDDALSSFVVELPVKLHNTPEVREAKEKEHKNLLDFDTYEEVDDLGQARLGSHWVIMKKEKHDGQKTLYKGRIVAKGFHEEVKPQSDSPTAQHESIKFF
jgi:hypothetical protein